MFDILPAPIRNFFDTIFGPPTAFLELTFDMINKAGTVAGKGINLGNYFSFFGYLPQSWQNVVQSALASVVLLAILYLVRASWDMYLKVKGSSKWW